MRDGHVASLYLRQRILSSADPLASSMSALRQIPPVRMTEMGAQSGLTRRLIMRHRYILQRQRPCAASGYTLPRHAAVTTGHETSGLTAAICDRVASGLNLKVTHGSHRLRSLRSSNNVCFRPMAPTIKCGLERGFRCHRREKIVIYQIHMIAYGGESGKLSSAPLYPLHPLTSGLLRLTRGAPAWGTGVQNGRPTAIS